MDNLTDIVLQQVGGRDDQPVQLSHSRMFPSGYASTDAVYVHPAGNSLPLEEQRALAWEITRAYGRTSLARYALLNDKNFFFTTGGSVVSHVVKNHVALALGDPIGPRQDAANSISEFKQYCSENHWLPAFYQVSGSLIETYDGFGFRSLQIGNEAIVDLPNSHWLAPGTQLSGTVTTR